LNQATTGDVEEEEEEEDEEEQLVHGRRKRKVAFMPSLSTFMLLRGVYTLTMVQTPPTPSTTVVTGFE